MRESMNEEALRRAREEAEAHARQQLEVGVDQPAAVLCGCCTVNVVSPFWQADEGKCAYTGNILSDCKP